ncbi:hypothetical protein BaRGS_00026184 [Batillaria attramentaria]|uniref:Uncharacterized protein n=1 Tax=Batillaria attramentaria TaxID=370345 RepID=A0ABD0K657_9CAEN
MYYSVDAYTYVNCKKRNPISGTLPTAARLCSLSGIRWDQQATEARAGSSLQTPIGEFTRRRRLCFGDVYLPLSQSVYVGRWADLSTSHLLAKHGTAWFQQFSNTV